ncbi:MAG: TIR domain-containing protein [Pseudomonadota bacterium]
MVEDLRKRLHTGEPPIVFVSYSHNKDDAAWKDELLPHLQHLEKLGTVEVWSDQDIKAGTDWYADIKHALRRTKVAICLISPHFLKSSFCIDEEVAYLLQARNRGDLEIIPILVEECTWEPHRWLSRLQMLPGGDKNLTTHFKDDPAQIFAKVSGQVHAMLQPGYVFERPPPDGDPPRIDIDRLPKSDDLVLGRQDELNLLDQIWSDDDLNVAVFRASGGVGKSSLVQAWVEDMALDNYRKAKRVYAWSFYSQGTTQDGSGGRVTSADEFVGEALDWFGDKSRGEGLSTWDRGRRLAELIQKERTLLLLDGMEPLQSGQDFDRGKLKDPGLEVLLDELGRHNPGLCLITTREEVTDLWHEGDEAKVGRLDLDTISTIAGRALLRVSGIEGKDAALEQAVKDFSEHAYAIKLLGSFLKSSGTPDIKHAADVPDLPEVEEEKGKHPRRVMAAFAKQFEDGAKADILAMLGLFDRPADAGCIAALREKPAIPGLNAAVLSISEAVWQEHIAELRKLGLLTPESHHAPDELDAHPIVREHFGARLRAERGDAWKAGHERLYEYLKASQKIHRPDTLAEMAPLFQAVHHGCQAGRRQEALDEVYHDRIVRQDEDYLVKKLGAFGADLGLVASFFDPPFERPGTDLREDARAWLLNQAAFRLRALGRLGEAVAPMRAGLKMRVEQENWRSAARIASNLSELQLTLGKVAAAVNLSEASVEHADKSGDGFSRETGRTNLAEAMHQAGKTAAAKWLLEEAEALQAEGQPFYPILYSLKGYRYCDLLLTLGRPEAVRERARETLEWAKAHEFLLDIALDHLSLGRAAMALGDRDEARRRLDQAVDGLREAGQVQELPHGLLARAAFFREAEEFTMSRRDLDEVMRIATRSGMRLFECDAHLEHARLILAEGGSQADARASFDKAEVLVRETGYHRRDGDVAELKEKLGL